MQKRSETVYAGLFWLISGLLVWLVIVPVALICLPVVLLVKALGQNIFRKSHSNITEANRPLQTSHERAPESKVQPLLASLLLTTLVEVPALLAAVISLQPTRLINGEPEPDRMLDPRLAKSASKSWTDSIEVTVEENRSDR